MKRWCAQREVPVVLSLAALLAAGLVLSGVGCDKGDDATPSADGDADAEESIGETEADTVGDDIEESGDAAAEETAEETVEYPWDDHVVTVMSFNVMCSFCGSAPYDAWSDRIHYFADIFARYAPDLIGLQEFFMASEAEEVRALVPQYRALFLRDVPGDLLSDYPDAAIFYRADRFEVLDEGYIWLSETPDVPWSGGWADSNLWRLIAWAKLRQISDGREFYFASTHFDNNFPNQIHSAPLALERMEPWAQDYPVIFVGDFNSKPDSEAYATLSAGIDGKGFHFINAFDIAADWSAQSNRTPPPDYDETSRIDHIWLQGTATWGVTWWKADQYLYGDKPSYPSDHFAIAAEIVW